MLVTKQTLFKKFWYPVIPIARLGVINPPLQKVNLQMDAVHIFILRITLYHLAILAST